MLLKNTIYQILSRVISASFTFISSILIIRGLGLTEFGSISLVLSVVAIFTAIAEFGSNTGSIKKFMDDQYLRENFGKFITFRITLVAVSLVAMIIFGYLSYGISEIFDAIILGAVIVIFNGLIKSFTLISQVKFDYRSLFESYLIAYLFGFMMIFLGFWAGWLSLMFIIANYFIVSALIAISLYFKYSGLFDQKYYLDWDYTRYLINDTWILGVTAVLNLLMVNVDRILISKYSTLTDLGTYSLAYRIFELALILPAVMMNVIFPQMLNETLVGDNSFNKALKRFTLIGVVLSAILWLGAGLIPFVWGSVTVDSVYALRILASGLILFYLTSPIGYKIVASSKRSLMPLIYLVGLFFNIGTNVVLLPNYGYVAAAYVTIITELIVFIGLIGVLMVVRQDMTKNNINVDKL